MFNGKDEEIRELLAENSELWEENTSVKNKLFKQQHKIDKAIKYIKDKLNSLNMNKSAIMRIVEPSNGNLLADVNYEIQKWEKLLEILGDKENE